MGGKGDGIRQRGEDDDVRIGQPDSACESEKVDRRLATHLAYIGKVVACHWTRSEPRAQSVEML